MSNNCVEIKSINIRVYCEIYKKGVAEIHVISLFMVVFRLEPRMKIAFLVVLIGAVLGSAASTKPSSSNIETDDRVRPGDWQTRPGDWQAPERKEYFCL